jgi:cell division protein FtsI/penicillin-binding protein 2
VLVGAILAVPVALFAARAVWQDDSSTDAATTLPPVSAPPPLDPLVGESRLSPPVTRIRFEGARAHAAEIDPSAVPRLVEWIDDAGQFVPVPGTEQIRSAGAIRVEYSLDEALTDRIFEILRRGRVARGHAIVLDPRSGRLLAYVSTDPRDFPAERAYPSASIVKVLTAAAMLEEADRGAEIDCVYRGNKYRLHYRRLERPKQGHRATLEEALASSNNQCFSQWALHVLGEDRIRETLDRFGWLSPPAPGHEPGEMEPVESKLDLGRLGSGLDGIRVTPLHVASLATILTDGVAVEPWWIDRMLDASDASLPLPPRAPPRRVLSRPHADALREMMVATTTRGTARGAFRSRRGRPVLPGIRVAGKTGNLTGFDPHGRYEWFLALAPAEAPTIAVVVLQLQSNLWWSRSTELAADILKTVFCESRRCDERYAERFTGDLGEGTRPMLISELSTEERSISR